MIGIFINLWNRLVGAGGAAISYVLDEYSGAAAAYSLRKLSSTYGGSAVRVRRASDNAEQDIGFVGQDLDETALMNFVGYQNLFQRSEEFENAYWVKARTTITANSINSPIGTLTADTISETATTGTHLIGFDIPFTLSAQSYTLSCYMKAGTSVWGALALYNGVDNFSFYNLQTGQVGSVTNGSTATITPVGDGWYRCTMTTVMAATNNFPGILMAQSNGVSSYAGNTANNIYIWGAQLNAGTTAQPYQVTTSAARSGDGFVTKWYTQDSNWENLLLQSQTFENASWTKNTSSITQNSTTAPDGTLTADSLNEISGFNRFPVFQPVTLSSLGLITASVYLKAKERRYAVVSITTGSSGAIRYGVVVDLQDGLIVGSASVNSATNTSNSISNAGNGWYRVSVSMNATTTAANSNYIVICPSNSPTPTYEVGTLDPLYNGTAGSGVFIWGAQLSQSTWLQPYNPTTTTAILRRDASQSTAANQPRIVGGGVIERENGKAAIRFDGTDDFLSLASDITYTTTGNQYISAVFTPAVAITVANIYVPLATIGTADSRMIYALGSVTSSLVNERLSYLTVIGGNVLGYGQTVSDLSPTPKLQSISFDPPSLFNIFQNSIQQQFSTSTSGAFSSSQYPSTFGRIGASPSPSSFFLGDMQEIILYGTSRSANRGDIDRNVGAYYQTQWTGASSGLLDQFGGAAAAYSLRNLSSSYRGPLIRVRRSSDNAETDIGGTYNGDLDVASLLSFTGGQNLILSSDNFAGSDWFKSNLTVASNVTIAPDGTLTADKLAETAVNSTHNTASSATTVATAQIHTTSAYFKAAERSIVLITMYYDQAPNYDTFSAFFNVSTGLVESTFINGSSVLISASIQPVGNGWYRCSVTGSTNKTGIHRQAIYVLQSVSVNPYLGVAGSGVYIWGAQLNTGILQPYIPTTTAAVNGANAFVTKWYTQDNNYQNLLLQSQTFENASWQKYTTSVSQDVITAPDGTLTADKLNELAVNDQHWIGQIYSIATASTFTVSFYLKAAERTFVSVGMFLNNTPFDYFGCVFNLSNGTVFSSIATGTSVLLGSSITPAGDGWYRCTVTGSTNKTGTHVVQTALTTNGVTNSYLGVVGSGVYIWGAQLNEGTLVPYTATTTTVSQRRDAIQATAASQPRIVNAGGVESEGNKPALFFDGVDDTINFDTVAPLFAGEDVPLSAFSTLRSISSSGWFFALADSVAPNPIHGYSTVVGSGIDNFRRSSISTQVIVANTDRSNIYKLNSHMFAGTTLSVSNNAVDNIVDAPQNVPSLDSLNRATIGSLRYQSAPNGNVFFGGDVGEFILYRANQFSLRQPIQSNINSYYRIYWQGNGTALLDSFSGASAAYSLRNLSSAYTGPLIRVRRSNDNVEMDIYGTFGGDLDIASLVAFVGANSGFVTTWYDQSGNARNATNGTAANQPRIVNAGVVETEGGKPSINFFGTSAFMNANGAFTGTSFTSLSVFKQPSTVSRNAYNLYTTGGTYVQIVEYSSNNSSYIRPSTGVATQYGSGVFVDRQLRSFTYIDSFIFTDYRNTGIFYSNNFGVTMTPSTSLQINRFGGTYGENLVFQELIFFPTDRSSIRTAVETNINNYYKIY